MRSLLAHPTVSYCEQAGQGLIKRPWSALSNLAFIGAGLAILLHGKGSRLSRLFGSVALLVGVLSTFYDITYTYGSQLLDLSGMLVFVGLLLYLNVSALGSRRHTAKLIILSIILSVSLIILLQSYAGDVIFGIYVLAVVATEAMLIRQKKHHNSRLWLIAFSIFILGFGFWLMDSSRLYCMNMGLLNGRAIFHYCGATAIYLLYRFYDNQRVLAR